MGETIISKTKKTGKNKTGELEKREKAGRKKAPAQIVMEAEPAASKEAQPDSAASAKKAKPTKGKSEKARLETAPPPKASKSRKPATFVDEIDLAADNMAKLVDHGRRVLHAAMSAPDPGELDERARA